MKNIIHLPLTLAVLVWAGSVWAHGELTPHYGGRIVEAETYHLEMVTKGGHVELYVHDQEHQPIAVGKAKAKVTFLVGQNKTDVHLVPAADEDKLVGEGAPAGGEQAAAVVTVEGLAKRLTVRIPAVAH
ncbi:MAG: hypothetical protein HQL73_03965 [Magnetococcales bacterium]|nr:hypothetical protein [Magnetococcales bacterium]